jgi:hypothetical protein
MGTSLGLMSMVRAMLARLEGQAQWFCTASADRVRLSPTCGVLWRF